MTERPRVLVAEDEQASALLIKRMVQTAGFDAVLVKDGVSALKEVERGGFHAAIIDWMLPELDGIEVVRALSKRPGARPRVILTSVIDIPSARSYALAAGAHDFVPKPIPAARLAELLRGPATRNEGAAPDNHPLTRTKAWTEMAGIVVKSMGDLLGVEGSSRADDEAPTATVGASCALADAAHGWELDTELLASDDAARTVGTLMLGEDLESTTAAEILSEILNVVVGAAKTALAAEGFSFTLGLAARLSAEECNRLRPGSAAVKLMAIEMGGAVVAVRFTVRAAGALAVRVEDLHEGHVLADDVLHPSGGMLLPAGTRLTESAAMRLAQTCKGRKVRVLAPVAAAA